MAFSLGMMDDGNGGIDMKKASMLGLQFVKDGKVSPEEISTAMEANADPDSEAAQLGHPLLAQFAAGKSGKGKQKKLTQGSKEETSQKTNMNLYQDADKFGARAEDFESLPFMQEQKQGIANAENMLNMQMQAKAPGASDYWIKPLLAMADAESGTKLSQSFTPHEDAASRMSRLLKSKGDIQDQKSAYSKQLLDGLTKMKEGTTADSTMNQLSQQLAMTQGMLNGGGAMGAYDDRRADIAHRSVVAAIKKDPILNKIMPVKNRLENAVNNSAGVDSITPQQFDEMQQAIRSSIAQGSSTGAERGATYYKSLGLKASEINQFLSGRPQNLKLSNPFVQHVLQIANLELTNLKKQAVKRGSSLTQGYESIYNARPDLKADRDGLIGASDESFEPEIDPRAVPMPRGKKVAAAPKPTAQMTDAEIDAELAMHEAKGK